MSEDVDMLVMIIRLRIPRGTLLGVENALAAAGYTTVPDRMSRERHANLPSDMEIVVVEGLVQIEDSSRQQLLAGVDAALTAAGIAFEQHEHFTESRNIEVIETPEDGED